MQPGEAESTKEANCGQCNSPLSACSCKTVYVNSDGDKKNLSTEGEAIGKVASQLQILGEKYKTKRVIGVGGMGTVYEASHIVLGHSVAIKLLRKELVEEASILKRFEHEAQACASLSHPNLVSVYDCGITAGEQPFLVMEYLEGLHLLDRLKSKKDFDAAEFYEIFLQVVSGLEYAHSKGVIHRDLKPTNIIVTHGPQGTIIPKIVDFGVAKIEDLGGNIQMLTQTGEVFGSPAYMSPEQCSGGVVDQRSDIYSLGCVMYEAITGKQAFAGHNMLTVLEKQLNEDPKDISEYTQDKAVPHELEAIVEKCLKKDPYQRFESCTQLYAALNSSQKSLKPSRSIFDAKNIALLVLSILLILLFSSKGNLPGNDIEYGDKKRAVVRESTLTDLMQAEYASSRLVYPDAIRSYRRQLAILDKEKEVTEAKIGVLASMLRLMGRANKYGQGVALVKKYKSDARKAENLKVKGSSKRAFANSLVQLNEFAGYIYGQTGNQYEAKNYYLKAIRLSRELEASDWIRARLHIDYSTYLKDSLQMPEDSYKQAKEATAVILSMPEPRQNLFSNLLLESYRRQVWAMWSIKDYPRLEESMQKAVEISANNRSVWYARDDFNNLIKIYKEQGKEKEAKLVEEQRDKVVEKIRRQKGKKQLNYKRFSLGPYLLDYKYKP